MKIRIKSPLDKPTIGAIKVLREYTPKSLEEIQRRFANHEFLFEFDTLELENQVIAFELIKELKNEDIELEFYEVMDGQEEQITEQMVRNRYERLWEIALQIERENELETTEVVVIIKDEVYAVFDFSDDLLEFLDTTKEPSVSYYKRTIDDLDEENWEQTNEAEIRELMRDNF